jgi:hypothetical protein
MPTACQRLGVILLSIPILAGCAARHAAADRQELTAALQSFREAEAAGRTGTITGNFYLLYPAIPTILRDRPVTLLPLTPGLEAAINEAGDRYAGTREPLSPEALAPARRLLDDASSAVKPLGGEKLIKTTRTDPKEASFTFADIPEGRWLLTAEFETPYSVLLWAVPVTVTAGHNTRQRLNDGNVWLEGLKP